MTIATIALAVGRAELESSRVVLDDGSSRPLTSQEVAILGYLAARPHEDVPREELLTEVLGYSASVVSRAVDDTMKRLRAKVERVPAQPFHLVGVRGVGYRFVPLSGGPGRLPGRASVLVLDDREVDLGRLEVRPFRGDPISLTAQEGLLIEVLARRAGEVVDAGTLLREVWGVRDLARRRVIDKLVYRLRPKLEADPANPVRLRTVRGRGLVLDVPRHDVEPIAKVGPAAEKLVLIGRDAELAALVEALEGDIRVVSVVGPAGSGKTALVRAAVSDQADVFLVDLENAATAADVWSVMAEALGVGEEASADPDVLLGAIDAHGSVVLLVDHAERIWADARSVVGRLVAETRVQILHAGRRSLDVSGERVVELGSLAPDDSVALLRQRASALGARLEPEHDTVLHAIAEQLDGLPLALELAAGPMRAIGPHGLLEALGDDALDVLDDTRGRRPSRHRSLRAALQGAWDDLSDEEQRFLARATVLRNGFGLVAAKRVLLGPDWTGHSAFELVYSLRERSLLRRWKTDAGVRFAPWRVVVDVMGEWADVDLGPVRRRHLAWLASLGDDLDPVRKPPPRHVAQLMAESADAEVAVRHGIGTDPASAARVLLWLVPILAWQGRARAAVELCGACRAALPKGDGVRLRLGLRQATAATAAGAWDASIGVLGSTGAEAADAGDRIVAFAAHSRRSQLLTQAGRTQQAIDALALLDAIGDGQPPPEVEGMVLEARGWLAFRSGDHGGAWRMLQDALGLARRYGDTFAEASLQHELAGLAHAEGRLSESEAFCELAAATYEAHGVVTRADSVRDTLGLVRKDQGRLDEASALYEDLLSRARRRGSRGWAAQCANRLGDIAGQRGNLAEAATWFTHTRAIAEELGNPALALSATFNLGEVARRSGRLDEALARFEESLEGYRVMARPSHTGIVLATIGRVHLDQGSVEQARGALEEAVELLRDTRGSTWGALARTTLVEARARLGDAGGIDDGEAALALLGVSWPGEGLCRGHVCMGTAHLALGDVVGARRHLRQAEAALATFGAAGGEAARVADRLRRALEAR